MSSTSIPSPRFDASGSEVLLTPASEAHDYWASGRGLDHIVPPGESEPEGSNFGDVIAGVCGAGKVLDFGCGIGRLARFFSPEHYLGVDICGQAIEIAASSLPSHCFQLLCGDALPTSDVLLAHTVLLHVPDNRIEDIAASFDARRVVISEILGRSWRRAGDPPVFNREKCDYIQLMAGAGYRFARSIPLRYVRYDKTDLTVMLFER